MDGKSGSSESLFLCVSMSSALYSFCEVDCFQRGMAERENGPAILVGDGKVAHSNDIHTNDDVEFFTVGEFGDLEVRDMKQIGQHQVYHIKPGSTDAAPMKNGSLTIRGQLQKGSRPSRNSGVGSSGIPQSLGPKCLLSAQLSVFTKFEHRNAHLADQFRKRAWFGNDGAGLVLHEALGRSKSTWYRGLILTV